LTSIIGEKILWSQWLFTNILQNNVFIVQERKETHTGLEQREGE